MKIGTVLFRSVIGAQVSGSVKKNYPVLGYWCRSAFKCWRIFGANPFFQATDCQVNDDKYENCHYPVSVIDAHVSGSSVLKNLSCFCYWCRSVLKCWRILQKLQTLQHQKPKKDKKTIFNFRCLPVILFAWKRGFSPKMCMCFVLCCPLQNSLLLNLFWVYLRLKFIGHNYSVASGSPVYFLSIKEDACLAVIYHFHFWHRIMQWHGYTEWILK